jgi:hypothetical protein
MSTALVSRSGNYLLGLVPPGTQGKIFFETYIITSADQAILQLAAREDGFKYAYNGLVSFLAGLAALDKRQAGWAITEMYYSAFYIARAALCSEPRVIFHVPKEAGNGHTQFELRIAAGEIPSVSKIPSTHKLVSARFRRHYPAFMASLEVDGNDPIEWLMGQREAWQYRAPRFSDPEFPDILKQFDLQKVGRLLSAYENDISGIYLADPEHALVAIPFRLVTWFINAFPLSTSGVFQPEDLTYLRKSCMSGGSKLTALSRYLES